MILLFATLAAAEPLSLTYEEALRRASEANPAVLGARLDYLSAEGALLAARAPFGAVFTADGSYSSSQSAGFGFAGRSESEGRGWNARGALTQAAASGTTATLSASAGDTYSSSAFSDLPQLDSKGWSRSPGLSVTLSQSLLQGASLAYNLQGVRSARIAQSVAEAARQGARQSALADTAKAYWALYYAERSVEIAAGAEATQREQARVVAALVDAGRLAPIESTRSAAAIAQAERTRLDAQNAAAAAGDALLALLGEQPGASITLITAPGTPPSVTLDDAAVVEAVRQANPDLVAARLREDAAQAVAKGSRNALLPKLDATGTYGYGRASTYPCPEDATSGELVECGLGDAVANTEGAETGGTNSWSLGLAFELPLANRADRGALDQRKAEAERARIDRLTLEIALAQQALTQVRSITTARRAVELAELNLSLAEETLRVEQARLQEGKALQKDVIAAVNELASARLGREKAIIDFQGAVVELERLKGSL